MITAPRTEVLQGTPELLVLKTPDTLGSFDGFGIARRIQQVSGDALLLNQGTPYPAPVRLRATQMDTFETKRFRVSDNSATARGHRRGTQKKPHLDLQVGLGLTTHTILWERPSRLELISHCDRSYMRCVPAICRLLVTEKTPGTALARISAARRSPSLLT